MNGHPDPQTLALWAGADLKPDAAAEVELHSEDCAECRRTVHEIEKAQQLLRSAFEEPSETDLARVRRGIAWGLETRRRTARWCWSFATLAASLVLLFLGLMHRKALLPTPQESTVRLPLVAVRIQLALEIPELKQMERGRRPHPHIGPTAGLRAVNFVPSANGSVQIKLTTADPNVIILLPSAERTVEQ